MKRVAFLCLLSLILTASAVPEAYGELMRGGATLSSVSSVVKISREGNGLDSLTEGEVLYVFTETGDPVSQIVVRDIFADEIHSEPLPDAVGRQIRESGAILIFSNLREYGDFIKAYLDGSKEAFGNFITSHPDSELREEAQRVFDGIVYRPYKLQGTPQALNEFIEKNPENYYVRNALRRRDDLFYQPVKSMDRISCYRWFVSNYPDNINVDGAMERISELLSIYENTTLEEVARYPRSHKEKKIKFSCYLQSALPVYVEGPGVGRKTAQFSSPRNVGEYLNFQVEVKGIVLWRLFVNREDETVVKTILEARKGEKIHVYGVVFDVTGGAPWIDVDDVEKN
ncbi:MAG: hypothetical protein RRA32_00160 [bacterium]|nr:hypothetical protein [bacterium]